MKREKEGGGERKKEQEKGLCIILYDNERVEGKINELKLRMHAWTPCKKFCVCIVEYAWDMIVTKF